MNSYTTREAIDILIAKAKAKTKLPLPQLIILGINAGALIAFGYLAFLRVSGAVPKEWGSVATFLGACVFPIGLIALSFLGGELLTGNMMVMTMAVLDREIRLRELFKNWLLVFLTNAIGGILVAFFFGHFVGLSEGSFLAKTGAVATAKLADGPLMMVVSGIGCNIFVCMAVFIATVSKDFLGKMFSLWFPIMIFVVCGFQHVVANAFILPAYLFAGGAITWGQIIENLIFVGIGNALGGALFVAFPLIILNPQQKEADNESRA
ncbi:formate/nitrite transporter family protein [Candidatus Enterococcus leclercqii]|uniref:formate/nitrite transporter family protein n=1 Tax=Candidatus Enterococcus leclercqii TaxID=1857218 RepID=UPI00137AAB44|nr:formate/nitrite transporter family protein [Enterococcus sp. CU9D]KAF1292554.1 formate-nitrite transporter [Enterococcus sp. CU9D]